MHASSLSVMSKSSGVWSSLLSPDRLPHRRTLVLALLQSAFSSSLHTPLTRAQEQRRDTFPSSLDGRTPRTSPSRTRGLGSSPPTLQLSEFEKPCLYHPPPNTSGVRRQHSHASWHRLNLSPNQRFSFILPLASAHEHKPPVEHYRPTRQTTHQLAQRPRVEPPTA